jgi:hypothetical protein
MTPRDRWLPPYFLPRFPGVKQLDNPYRAIIDAGVIVGLSWDAQNFGTLVV